MLLNQILKLNAALFQEIKNSVWLAKQKKVDQKLTVSCGFKL